MTKKIEIYPNNEVAYIVPPEPIDENESICLADYFIPEAMKSCLTMTVCAGSEKIPLPPKSAARPMKCPHTLIQKEHKV